MHVGCWAHARRKFFEAREVSKNKGSADVALSGIDSLFGIERTLRDQDLTPEQFTLRRREQVEPVLEKLRAWLQEREGQVPPSTTLGKAIGYTVGQWPKLIRYLGQPSAGPRQQRLRAGDPTVRHRSEELDDSGQPGGSGSQCSVVQPH